jgi:DNA-binding protein YbaB
MESPDEAAMRRINAELHSVMEGAVAAQRKLLEIEGTAWSDDRLIKVVVGPRGQLVDLEIDPRVGNRLNTAALARTILATARAATEQAMASAREILDEDVPKDMRGLRETQVPGGFDLTDLLTQTDTDLHRIIHEDDEKPDERG